MGAYTVLYTLASSGWVFCFVQSRGRVFKTFISTLFNPHSPLLILQMKGREKLPPRCSLLGQKRVQPGLQGTLFPRNELLFSDPGVPGNGALPSFYRNRGTRPNPHGFLSSPIVLLPHRASRQALGSSPFDPPPPPLQLTTTPNADRGCVACPMGPETENTEGSPPCPHPPPHPKADLTPHPRAKTLPKNHDLDKLVRGL